MLSVLQFKKSLFAGVLDGGETEVFLGGSRLNKFMETVESATTAIPEAMAEDAVEAPARWRAGARQPPEGRRTASESKPAPAATADPWTGLLQAGMALLQQFAGGSGNGPAAGTASSLVRRDERTGEAYLKVPMPKPEVLDQALQAVQTLLQSMRK